MWSFTWNFSSSFRSCLIIMTQGCIIMHFARKWRDFFPLQCELAICVSENEKLLNFPVLSHRFIFSLAINASGGENEF